MGARRRHDAIACGDGARRRGLDGGSRPNCRRRRPSGSIIGVRIGESAQRRRRRRLVEVADRDHVGRRARRSAEHFELARIRPLDSDVLDIPGQPVPRRSPSLASPNRDRQEADAARSRCTGVGRRALEGAVLGVADAARRHLGGICCTRFFGGFVPLSGSNSPRNLGTPCDAAIWAGFVSDSETIPAQIRIPPRWRHPPEPCAPGGGSLLFQSFTCPAGRATGPRSPTDAGSHADRNEHAHPQRRGGRRSRPTGRGRRTSPRLVGAYVASGARSTPIRSTAARSAPGRRAAAGQSRRSAAATSRWTVRRRSIIEMNGSTAGASAAEARNVAELLERPGRQRGRDGRHEQGVGGAEHALAGQRDARRAVEEGHVVGRRRRGASRAARRSGVVSSRCRSRWRNEKSAGSTCMPGHVGGPDVVGELAATGHEPLGAALQRRA